MTERSEVLSYAVGERVEVWVVGVGEVDMVSG